MATWNLKEGVLKGGGKQFIFYPQGKSSKDYKKWTIAMTNPVTGEVMDISI